ncbi:MAG: dihydrofolate reductase [Patescibacteria group bacterium]
MAFKIIAALSENKVIGSDGSIPWKLPDDMVWFKNQTGTTPVVMGRKTYESLPNRFRPLPNRENIVLTSSPDKLENLGITVISDFRRALDRAAKENIWVIGGGEIYRLAIPHASHLYLTRVNIIIAGDTFFPKWSGHDWRLVSSENHARDAKHDHNFTWEIWVRK